MIALILNDGIEKYEQDIRELAMAFCPGEPFIYEKNRGFNFRSRQ